MSDKITMNSEANETCSEKTQNRSKMKNGTKLRLCGRRVKKDNLLVTLTLTGVFLGIVLGITLRYAYPSDDAKMLIAFPGEILLRILKMLVIPLISTSIITGVAELTRKKNGKVGLHIMIYYISTTVCAILIGIALVSVIKPGLQKETNEAEKHGGAEKKNAKFSTLDTVLDLIRNLFPSNLVEAWFRLDMTTLAVVTEAQNNSSQNVTTKLVKHLEKTDGSNALGLITFCIMLGMTLGQRKSSKSQVLSQFFDELFLLFMDVVKTIMWYAPVGICSLIAGNLVLVDNMLYVLNTLGLYIVTTFVSAFIHSVLLLPFIYWLVTRKNPYKVYAGCLQAVLTMIGTTSSAATLPTTMRCAEENLGIDKRFTRVMLPLGATINMDGTALLQGILAITIAQMYGVDLTVGQIITICLTGTLASVGAASIPGTGLVVVLFVLQSVGLPVEAVGLFYAVDWMMERLRGTLNILGDVIGVCLIAHLNRDGSLESENEPLDGDSDTKV